MLSPATVILAGTAARPGNAIVQPEVLDVAVRTYVVGVVSPVTGTERMFHFPAKSARLTGVAAAVPLAVELAIMLLVSAAALSFLAQPARTAAQPQSARRVERWSVNMVPPV
jgi:hypothetical protein